ncbi:MAG TPA: response regulator transcription factor [Burkholderiales bacterium]|nr:response regulator transcription factor [Burkholderiales bacterium]
MAAQRILLVDDHALVRAGMKSLLHEIPGVEVVAEAADGAEALRLAAELRPDVVLLDIAMKGMNGLDAAARLREQLPATKVIVLSMHTSEEYVLLALRAGAAGYLIKDSATSELELALKAVARGETYLSPAISRQVVDGYVQRVGAAATPDPLTPRQREVLKRIAEGRSTKEIAFDLKLSVKTVETHRAQIMERLGIRDVAGLVRYAMRAGLVPPET